MPRKLLLTFLTASFLVFSIGALPSSPTISAAATQSIAQPVRTLTDATATQDQQFAAAFQTVQKWIGKKAFPGAVLAVGQHGTLLVLKAFGKMMYEADGSAMPANTIFDLASCSKVVGCTTAAAILYDRKQLDLDAPVVQYLPEFKATPGHEEVLVRHLLTHCSGIKFAGWPTLEADARPRPHDEAAVRASPNVQTPVENLNIAITT